MKPDLKELLAQQLRTIRCKSHGRNLDGIAVTLQSNRCEALWNQPCCSQFADEAKKVVTAFNIVRSAMG